ncbi:MAG: hypothetical protein WA919_29005 [Coleofasciculaceae cyanobacterium]
MQAKITWQLNSDNLDNGDNLAKIQKLWATLKDRKIAWRQRIIPESGDVSNIDWGPQRFDEIFPLQTPEIRGITLYWRKPDSDQERSTTPHKLELDTHSLQLYIYPQSQKNLVIRVSIPETIYQKIAINNPQWESSSTGENHILLLRDKQQQIEVTLSLSPDNIAQLKEHLPE